MIHAGLDVGHAAGTGARCGHLDEHELNAELAQLVARKLKAHGIRVTIYDFPALNNRTDLNRTIAAANADGVDFLVSFHADCCEKVTGYKTVRGEDGEPYQQPILSPDTRARGAHACYVSKAGRKLAAAIARYLCALLPGRAEHVQHRDKLAILNRTDMPATLLENGFITSPDDMALVVGNMEAVADAIVNGILDYLTP